eukprot:jgi/Botrbrau1/8516/Bobra.0029s0020.1
MQDASLGDLPTEDIFDILELDLADPLGPDLFEGEWVAPRRRTEMEGGDDYPEWTAAELLFEPYALTLMQNTEGVSSNLPALTPNSPGTGGGSASGTSGKEANTDGHALPGVLKGKLPRWKRRTKEQTEANKRAQKLYRERKKAKMRMLEAEQEALQKRVTDLEKLAALEAENQRLLQELQATKVDLDEARKEAKVVGTQASEPRKLLERLLSRGSQQGSVGIVEGPEVSGYGPYPKRNFTEVFDKWLNQVNELWKFLEVGKLLPSHQTYGIEQQTMENLDQHMKLVMHLCMEVLNLGGLDIERLLGSSMEAVGGAERAHASDAKYLNIVKSLNLTVDQRRKAAKFQQHCKPIIERIYEERRSLNMEAIRVLTENPSASILQHAKTSDVLARLIENLRKEQCALSEQHYLVFRMLLSATQGAWLVVRAFPHHCDCMAVFRAIEAIGPLPKDYGGWLDI